MVSRAGTVNNGLRADLPSLYPRKQTTLPLALEVAFQPPRLLASSVIWSGPKVVSASGGKMCGSVTGAGKPWPGGDVKGMGLR